MTPSRPEEVTLIVIAKAPAPGRSKTRLEPALGPAGAAGLAAAALADTLEVVAAARGRSVLALDGEPGPWLGANGSLELVRQRGRGLGERLAAAFEDVGGPALLVGMDTPQLDLATIDAARRRLCEEPVDAVIGLAEDGGWWALGLREPDRRAFAGVPMSTPRTGAAQIEALLDLGLRVAELPRMRDVDTIEDARIVAAAAPRTRFAAALAELDAGMPT
jgi:uncharacterized protein